MGKYPFDFSGKEILVVEDNEMAFALISAMLKQVRAGITRARNGQEAIDVCCSDTPVDLVLMDLQLPQVDGYAATREIKRCHPGLPVIATTANAFDEDREACLQAGCDAYFSKPLHFMKLFETMSACFRNGSVS
ncbi:MAG: response regulator [Bacteroidales bacterium]